MDLVKAQVPTKPRSVLVVHTAVSYAKWQGLGIGLVQRVASARSGKTIKDVMKVKTRGFKVPLEYLGTSTTNPHERADMLALLRALSLAAETVRNEWPKEIEPAKVLILLGRPCDEIVAAIKHHLEFEPESYRRVKGPDRSTIQAIVRKIHAIRRHGFQVSITMSDHHDTNVQAKAAKEAQKRFNKVCRDLEKKHSKMQKRR